MGRPSPTSAPSTWAMLAKNAVTRASEDSAHTFLAGGCRRQLTTRRPPQQHRPMSYFDEIGVSVEESTLTETLEIGPMRSEKQFAVRKLQLPEVPAVQASFSREGITKKIFKLFKKELQVGDGTFDDIVYVSTDTPEQTAALLTSPDVRALILHAVDGGGAIEIDGKQVVLKIPSDQALDDLTAFRFVQKLLP
ncbi:hypothetical protein [Nannocystis sp. SCPEA4]|uniref:hypothetical protein n=1 Tax=Nannocystis sp. SCPEA4 TaxID=2996787 RepID=UPI0022703470|nr:hypothetical protein [Nannocystis sp. SCPEA4]MCY1053951.1 hypothetical protein [Nannocystis sp. SCPEA4]